MELFRRARFLEPDACARICAAMDAGEVEPAEVLAEDRPTSEDLAVRRAASVEVDVSTLAMVEAELDRSRRPIARFFRSRLGAREGPGFLCYAPGGFYKPHRDRAVSADWRDASRRLVTLVLFLNQDFRGGELRLLPDDDRSLVIPPTAGTLVAFDAGVVHEVLPVLDGRRYSVIDWWL